MVDVLRGMREQLDRGQSRDAWRSMCQAIAMDSTAAVCESVSAAMANLDAREGGLAELRVAILTNVTIDPIVPILVAQGARAGLAIRPYLPGVDTWAQEALNPQSGLRRHQPDIVLVYLRLELLSPRLATEFLAMPAVERTAAIEDAASRLEQVLMAVRSWSTARMLVHTFASPLFPTLGILDDGAAGQTPAIAALNARVRAAVDAIGDAFVVETDRVRARVGESNWHDARMWAMAKLPHGSAALNALVQEYLRVLRAVAGRSRKVLVLDADETLWGGIVGELGADGVVVGDRYPGSAFLDVQRAVLEWHRRGVVLGLLSKNDEADVVAALDRNPAMLLRSTHFAAMRVNWDDKAANMVALTDELGLALESIVFVDDSSVECDRMRQALPEVLTIQLDGEPAGRAAALRSLGVFDSLSYGADDRARGAQYRTEADRRRLQRELPSLHEFYASLEMTLTIEPVATDTLARAADLTQRTNQFNLNPRRYTAPELQAALGAPGCEGFLFRLRDRFGDSGIIGFAMIEARDGQPLIAQLLLSCRVLERTVEDSVLAFVVERVRRAGLGEVTALAQQTRRNGPARTFVAARGFEATPGDTDGSIVYRLAAGREIPFSPWVTIAAPIAGSVR